MRARGGGETGLTVVEMAVAIASLSLIFVFLFRTVDALTKTTKLADQKVTAAAENFLGLEALQGDLRLAVATPSGPYRYVIGPDRDWISYLLVRGEELAGDRVTPRLSPRIYVYRDGDSLLRAVVDDAGQDPPFPPEVVREVRVLARRVVDVEFGDPLEHAGAFTVRLVTMVGNPNTDRRVSTTNFVTVTSLNEFAGIPPDDPEPLGPPVAEFVEGSRGPAGDRLSFAVRNVTDEPLVVNGFRLAWTEHPAYYGRVRMNGMDVWRWSSFWAGGEQPAGPGDSRRFNRVEQLEIPPGEAVQIEFVDFRRGRLRLWPVKQAETTPYTLTLLREDVAHPPVEIPPR